MIKLHDLFIGNFKVSQKFGVNFDTYKWIKDYKGNSIKGHNGIDFGYGGKNGVELLNPFPNGNEIVCTRVGYDKKGYGYYCRLWDKTQGFVILYAHCQEIKVKQGDKIHFQQLVALGDNTGWSTGPHLHAGGYKVDNKGNKLNRDNGYDGWVDLLSHEVEWEILNPKKPKETKNDDAYQGCLKAHKQAMETIEKNDKEIEELKKEIKILRAEIGTKDKQKRELDIIWQNKLNIANGIVSQGITIFPDVEVFKEAVKRIKNVLKRSENG